MDKISRKEFEEAQAQSPEQIDEDELVSEDEFEDMLKSMQNPVLAQKKLAVQIKIFLDKRIEKEIEKNKYLSESTRKWVETYNGILVKLQTALHGDKTLNLHVHKISHSDISSKIRESVVIINSPEKKSKRKSES